VYFTASSGLFAVTSCAPNHYLAEGKCHECARGTRTANDRMGDRMEGPRPTSSLDCLVNGATFRFRSRKYNILGSRWL
jgi:hypothetical protein